MLYISTLFIFSDLKHNSTQYIHIVTEALRLAFADACKYCADSAHSELPIEQLLSEEYARGRAKLISKEK